MENMVHVYHKNYKTIGFSVISLSHTMRYNIDLRHIASVIYFYISFQITLNDAIPARLCCNIGKSDHNFESGVISYRLQRKVSLFDYYYREWIPYDSI